MKNAVQSISDGLQTGTLVPFLGPGVLELDGVPPVPSSAETLVQALCHRAPVPGRIRNNLWSSAQFIESRRHRKTVVRAMEGIFAPEVKPNPLQCWLAALPLPMIVDAWYDGAMVAALAQRTDWGQIQAVTRNSRYTYDIWYRCFDPENREVSEAETKAWKTLLYKPHGAVLPNTEMLISDSDYVEVLTEIDIQSPIPKRVQDIRSSVGFVFFGCHFSQQMDRIFAREILKRSKGPYYAILPGELTKNEEKFLTDQNIIRVDMPLREVVGQFLHQEDYSGAEA